jgi:hypothetical protein
MVDVRAASTTSAADVSRLDFTNYIGSSLPARTQDSLRQREQNYKEGGSAGSVTPIGGELRLQTAVKGDKHAPTQAARPAPEPQRFKGVVDRIDPASSSVTLSYQDRDNPFLFPTPLLESAGAAYVGALFEIVMTKEDGFHSYDIVHLAEEERKARAEARMADLSFLDEFEHRPRAKRK